jgi:hypothetical protein
MTIAEAREKTPEKHQLEAIFDATRCAAAINHPAGDTVFTLNANWR